MKTLASVVVVLMVASAGFGATVLFNASPSVMAGTAAVIPISLQGPAAFSSADIDFIADAGTLSFTAGGPVTWGGTKVTVNSAKDLTASFWMSAAGADSGAAAAAVGTLTVDTTGLAPATYNIVVNGDVDGVSYMGFTQLDPEAIAGTGSFTVKAPEPATMALLALGGLLVARRRHA